MILKNTGVNIHLYVNGIVVDRVRQTQLSLTMQDGL